MSLFIIISLVVEPSDILSPGFDDNTAIRCTISAMDLLARRLS
jgi:hypothetical protein